MREAITCNKSTQHKLKLILLAVGCAKVVHADTVKTVTDGEPCRWLCG